MDVERSVSCFFSWFARRLWRSLETRRELILSFLRYRLGMEVIHTTDSPLKQVSLGENMAGVWDDFHRRDELVSSLPFHLLSNPSAHATHTHSSFLLHRSYISKEKPISIGNPFVLFVLSFRRRRVGTHSQRVFVSFLLPPGSSPLHFSSCSSRLCQDAGVRDQPSAQAPHPRFEAGREDARASRGETVARRSHEKRGLCEVRMGDERRW